MGLLKIRSLFYLNNVIIDFNSSIHIPYTIKEAKEKRDEKISFILSMFYVSILPMP
jgi:hypothetical protein